MQKIVNIWSIQDVLRPTSIYSPTIEINCIELIETVKIMVRISI